jgi:uncharacterized protein YukJ
MVKNFGMLIATPVSGEKPEHSDKTPHFYLWCTVGAARIKIVINVRSALTPHDLYAYFNKTSAWALDYTPDPKIIAALSPLAEGWYDEAKVPIKSDFVTTFQPVLKQFQPIQCWGPTASDLEDLLLQLVERCAASAQGDPKHQPRVYAFGQRFGGAPGGIPDGVHDIHLNQGNKGRFAVDNSRNTDGLCMVQYWAKGKEQYALFMAAFQSQWLECDANGMVTSESHPLHDYLVEHLNHIPDAALPELEIVPEGKPSHPSPAPPASSSTTPAQPAQPTQTASKKKKKKKTTTKKEGPPLADLKVVLTRAMKYEDGRQWVEIENLCQHPVDIKSLQLSTSKAAFAPDKDTRVIPQYYRAIIEITAPILKKGQTVRLCYGMAVLDQQDFNPSQRGATVPFVFNRDYF